VGSERPANIFRALDGGSPKAAATATPPAPVKPVPCPWSLQVTIVEGRTQLEARSGDKVQLRVTCDELNMQSPNGAIQAKGNVQVAGLDLKGTCEVLTITWQDESVALSGKVHLNGQEIELNADKLSLKPAATKSAKVAGDGEGQMTFGGGFLP
jgi:hypothetical protein